MPPGPEPAPAGAELPPDAIAADPAPASSRVDRAGGEEPAFHSTPTYEPERDADPPRAVETIAGEGFIADGVDRGDEGAAPTLDHELAFASVPAEVVPSPRRRRWGESPAPEPLATATVAAARRRDATPRRPETGRPERAADAEPAVYVHIGRIDVKAVTPPQPAGKRTLEPPIESLDDYLRRSTGRR